MEGAVGLDDHAPDAPPRRLVRLVARALHDGRRPLARGHRGLRAPARAGPHLPRQAPRQLGPGAADRGLRPRGRVARGEGQALAHPLSARRTATATSSSRPRGPETMLGDVAVAVHPDDERYRHLIGTRVAPAAHRSHDPDHRRRLRRPRVRHRLREDHAGARLQRLPGRRSATSSSRSTSSRSTRRSTRTRRRATAASTASRRASSSSRTSRPTASSPR